MTAAEQRAAAEHEPRVERTPEPNAQRWARRSVQSRRKRALRDQAHRDGGAA